MKRKNKSRPLARPTSEETVEKRILDIIVEQLGVARNQVAPDSKFIEDLGANSLDTVELVMAMEAEFGREIPDEGVQKLQSVGDVVKCFEDLTKEDSEEQDEKLEIDYQLVFRLRHDGAIEAVFVGTDGSVTDAGAHKRLISGIYVPTRSDLASILGELEELVNNRRTKEQDLQRFFEAHPELLKEEPEDTVIPQARIITSEDDSWKADFFIKPVDDLAFCRVLELKLPTLRLDPRRRSGHTTFFGHLLAAIEQLRDYGGAFADSTTRAKFEAAYGIRAGKARPDLQLIAGRRVETHDIEVLQQLQRDHAVTVVDYDTLIQRLRRKLTC